MARSAQKSPKAIKLGGMRPMLLAFGLGLYWFVEHQDGGADADAPMWGYLVMAGVRLLAAFVGAWFLVSAIRLAIALLGFALAYLRALWPQEG
jgi:apolipoprotein N-acyltransferase